MSGTRGANVPSWGTIYQLRRDCRLVSVPLVPLLDTEEYAQHLVVNTNRQYDNLDNAAGGQDRGAISLQRWPVCFTSSSNAA